MAMFRNGSASVVESNVKENNWLEKKCLCGNFCFKDTSKQACKTASCPVKVARNVFAKYSPTKYLLSHCTIIAAVDVDEAKDKTAKYKDYLIKPEYSQFVNNNGDAWTKKMLASCYRSFIGANNYCFPAGTRILMSDGTYKNIELIHEGDKVINRNGEIAKVLQTVSHTADGLLEIESTNILSRSLFVTKEHPFWVYKARKTCPKTGRPNFFNADVNFSNLNNWIGFSTGVHKKKGESFPCGITPDWVEASKLDPKRDFFTHPVSLIEIPNTEINENRAELIGWFIAEGSYMSTNKFCEEDESGIVFNLGNDEVPVADRLSDLLIKEFGNLLRVDCKPRLYEAESGSYCLYLSNIEVAKFFMRWCGKYAWGKRMPEEAMWLPKNLQAIIIKSCLKGDGCGTIDSRGYGIEIKSQYIIQQLNWMSWRLGLLPTYRETGVLPRYTDCEIVNGYEVYTDPITNKKSRPGYILRFTVDDSKKLNTIVNELDAEISKRVSKRASHIFYDNNNSWIVSKIDKISTTDVSCEVHNIQVEGDNSYIAEGVVVHNCEHVQIPELSKGKVVDAVLREVPIGKDKQGNDLTTYYVDILVATDRKHEELVNKISSGQLKTLSMGCTIQFSQCSKCGNIAKDETEACQHVRYEKNSTFYDNDGTPRKVAELCGHASLEDSVKFVDASWVANPAFTGAVIRNVIEPPKDIQAKIESANKKETYLFKEGEFLKAASALIAADPEPPEDEPATTTDELKPPEDKTPDAPVDAPADEPVTEEEAPAEGDVNTWKQQIKQKIMNELGEEIAQEFSGESDDLRPSELETLDESLIQPTAGKILKKMGKVKRNWDLFLKKTAGNLNSNDFNRLRHGTYIMLTSSDLTELAKYGYNRREFLAVMSYLDECTTKPMALPLKRVIASMNGTEGKNPLELLTSLVNKIGRKLTKKEAMKSISWLKLMDSYKE